MIIKYQEFIKESKKWSADQPSWFDITNYEWSHGKLNCHQSVILSNRSITEIPFVFGKIDSFFSCSMNPLTSLKNGPEEVIGDFYCNDTGITSLEYGPTIVGGSYSILSNPKLISIKGISKTIPGTLFCSDNVNLDSLEYFPEYIGGAFFCRKTPKLKSIEQYPLSIIKGGIIGISIFKKVYEVVSKNEEIFEKLLDNKIKFHQMVMRLNPSLIKYYKTIQPPSIKTIL